MWGELGSALVVIVAIGTVAGFGAAGVLAARRTNLREQLADERELTSSLRAQRLEDRATIAQLTADLSAAHRIVTAEVHWERVTRLVLEHNKAAERHWRIERSLLADIAVGRHPDDAASYVAQLELDAPITGDDD